MNHEFNPKDAGALAERLGIVISQASADNVTGTMPVAGNTQPFGLLNGGASLALAETLGSIAAHLAAGAGRTAVGIEVSGSHHRSAREGVVTGVATPISVGKTLGVYGVTVTSDDGTLLCTARVTCLFRALP